MSIFEKSDKRSLHPALRFQPRPAETHQAFRFSVGSMVAWSLGVYFSTVLLTFTLLVQPVWAQVDQEHWPNMITSGFNSTMVRQEFTPSLDALDSLQLSIGQSGSAPMSPLSGRAAVVIRDGGVAGPIVAESSQLNLPAYFQGAPVFHFLQPVSLTPGRTYAFEMISLTDNAYWLLGGSHPFFSASYPGGRLYFGNGFDEGDLLFREGFGIIPEPSPLMLLSLSLGFTVAVATNCRKIKLAKPIR